MRLWYLISKGLPTGMVTSPVPAFYPTQIKKKTNNSMKDECHSLRMSQLFSGNPKCNCLNDCNCTGNSGWIGNICPLVFKKFNT